MKTNLLTRIFAAPILAGALALGACAGTTVSYQEPAKNSKPVPNIMYRLNDFFFNASIRASINQRGERIVEGYRNRYTGDAGAGDDIETSALIKAGTPGYCITPIGNGEFKFKYLGSGTWAYQEDFNEQVVKADSDGDRHLTEKESKTHLRRILAENQRRYPDCNSPKYKAYEREFNNEFDKETQDMRSGFNQRKKEAENSFRQKTRNYGDRR